VLNFKLLVRVTPAGYGVHVCFNSVRMRFCLPSRFSSIKIKFNFIGEVSVEMYNIIGLRNL
jgi:hypothetical protein